MPHALTALALLARLAAAASAPEELPSVELSDALGANAPPNATSGFQPKEMEVPEAPVDESWRAWAECKWPERSSDLFCPGRVDS